jgi:hypothetical protein
VLPVKKGRHRRFEEARALKRTGSSDLDELFEGSDTNKPCVECGGIYGLNQASWCPGPPECEAAVRALAAFPEEAAGNGADPGDDTDDDLDADPLDDD